MRPNPIADVAAFLIKPTWPTPVFWLLLLASIAVAVMSWRRRTISSPADLGLWLLRLLLGCMWWQQSLWKIPPDFDGLTYFLKQMVEHATTHLQSDLVAQFVMPNIPMFGWLVYLLEVVIGVALILGAFTRIAALLGLLMALNLWAGLYSAPGEWPWTYFFLVMLMARTALDPRAGVLGLDELRRAR